MTAEADNPAVIAHVNAMQDVIRRMADNSRSCKLWCVTLVAAMLVLMTNSGREEYALLALVPVIMLGFLDVYYLSLEQRFRKAYHDFVTKLHNGELDPSEVFVIKPIGSPVRHVFRSARSMSVWPFYAVLAVVVIAVAMMA